MLPIVHHYQPVSTYLRYTLSAGRVNVCVGFHVKVPEAALRYRLVNAYQSLSHFCAFTTVTRVESVEKLKTQTIYYCI